MVKKKQWAIYFHFEFFKISTDDMITCNRDPSSFPEATAPHLNKTYIWQKIIVVALIIKFGRKRTSDLLVYCGQSKCVGSTMHWKVWSESPRDKESIHSRSSDDNRQNNQKIIYLLRSPKGIHSASDMIESTVIIFITLKITLTICLIITLVITC